ncbi:polyadenylate-binding protein-interacting protein 4-like isoform X1 [Papaver somniferum]|uniref:polyadenylate-binding protein-interacting protein 4-like isoform X1 n=1 Tax=Papaver somniferum TaxID=3469 RepID=UPI000E701AC0|nr:polyadenylate-binding protein-interacting protein 4-like isoform X1 [Papaver somniferum]
MQKVVQQPRVSGNGVSRRRGDSQGSGVVEDGSNVQFPKSVNPSNNSTTTEGGRDGGKIGHDRLIYVVTCLIGQQVEVYVKNGSVFSGIFHSTNAASDDKDFGIILKMARLVKDGSCEGQNFDPDIITVPPSKTLIIPATELVQVLAKDVSVTGNDVEKGLQGEKRQDIMIDSSISKLHLAGKGRQLERWIPEDNDSRCPDLENVFDATDNRKWDQFEINKTLFGVESTFDEEIYTTKLVKGPQMKELEREALRIAKEIEAEDTQDLHLAEERGIHFHDDCNIDEETRYSSVFRGHDDSGWEEADEINLDSLNNETFGGSSSSVISKSSDMVRGKNNDGATASSEVRNNKESSSHHNRHRDHPWLRFSDQARQDKERRMKENQSGEHHQEDKCKLKTTGQGTLAEAAQTLNSAVMQSSLEKKKITPDNESLSSSTKENSPSCCTSSSKERMVSSSEFSESRGPGKAHGSRPWKKSGSSISSTSDCIAAVPTSSSPGLSPSSSISSLSSEKSKLNPFAREFKLNPNAKSFTPTPTPLRPPSPVADVPYYFPTIPSAVQYMHGLPVGLGIGPVFTAPLPVMYGFQAAPVQAPQAFVHPTGPPPVYVQQTSLSHSRQGLNMPTYPHEMTSKRRDS